MRINCNGKIIEVPENTTIYSVKKKFKNDADIIILNGHIVERDYKLKNNDEIFLIKKGEQPNKDELMYLLVARHSPKIFNKLIKSVITIAGLGGIGSNCAAILARMGAGSLILVDYDIVEPSNLNRQYYFINQIGMAKTTALKETLNKINPYLKYITYNEKIDEGNIEKFCKNSDIILEAFDKKEAKTVFINKCIKLFPNKKIIGVSGVAGLSNAEDITIQQISDNLYLIGDFISEARVGQRLLPLKPLVLAQLLPLI
ncbi:MAG: sulfur carrier protein ThiS adenylyltransferase ThiF [Deferribacterota bacterium]|nr:sulfur carrier protein ThiS adenylyltransferase ThiF [Deferribacterota bacterium]